MEKLSPDKTRGAMKIFFKCDFYIFSFFAISMECDNIVAMQSVDKGGRNLYNLEIS